MLARLEEQYRAESDAWLRDDLEIARLTVRHAARGDAVECSPHVLASYEVLGVHPDKVWPKILARRKALGIEDFLGAAPRKKPPQSVPQQLWLWAEKTNGARARTRAPRN